MENRKSLIDEKKGVKSVTSGRPAGPLLFKA